MTPDAYSDIYLGVQQTAGNVKPKPAPVQTPNRHSQYMGSLLEMLAMRRNSAMNVSVQSVTAMPNAQDS